MRVVLRVLSWPFLFIGGIGLGTQIISVVYRKPDVDSQLRDLLTLLIAGAIFCIGYFFRWLSTIKSFEEVSDEFKGIPGIFQRREVKPSLVGTQCPELIFYDKRSNPISVNDFKNRIVVIKPWRLMNNSVIDSKIWRSFDDSRIVYMYVYAGNDTRMFQEEPTPKWQKAKAYLVHDKDENILGKLGDLSGPNCLIIDKIGIIRRVPKYSGVYMNEYYDTPVVKKLLRQMPKHPTQSKETHDQQKLL